MPLPGIPQPGLLPVDDGLRLRRFGEPFDFALGWYRDEETVWLVDGRREPYDLERLARMYRYLDGRAELYWIELDDGRGFRPIGDVAFSQDDLPIVIGERACRGQGVGRRVVSALIRRAGALGFDHLGVEEIYRWNIASQRLFQGLGFQRAAATQRGWRYRLEL